MMLDTITIRPPSFADVVLGVLATDTAGLPYGYTLDAGSRISPGPLRVWREELEFSTGGLVVPGRRGPRTVELNGRVIGRDDDETNELARLLAEACSDHGPALVELAYTVEGVARVLEGTVDGELTFARDGGWLTYQVAFVCPDPVAHAETVTTVTLSGAPGATCSNTGNAEVWPLYEVTVTSGAPTGIKVGCTTTGRYVELAGLTTTTGDVLTIDTTPGSQRVELNGVSARSKMTALSRMHSLPAGDSQAYVTVTAGTGAVSATVEFRSGWVS